MIFLEVKEKLEVEKLFDKRYEDFINYNFNYPNEYEALILIQIILPNSKQFGFGYYFSPFSEEKIITKII